MTNKPVETLVRVARRHHHYGMLCQSTGHPYEAASHFKERREHMAAARTVYSFGIVIARPKRRQFLLG